MNPAAIIAKKRDGGALCDAEIEAVIRGATDGSWADYQLSAWLMATFLRGLDAEETVALTRAMLNSGTVVDLSALKQPKADKHSTGGVGDKISLVLAPMVAACGVAVPMISGRGLGHSGGTLDKLEAIPGFRVGLSLEEYHSQLARIGIALIGQTAELAPADKKLYALRDVTATVESIPLICASILSKKLAEGIDVLVLDVKFGGGAFMADRDQARELARTLVTVATALGKPTRAVLTAMNEPLGHTVGNALEVAESITCLRGGGPADVMEVTYILGEQMLLLAGAADSPGAARQRLAATIADGSALAKFRELIAAQSGDPRVADDPSLLPAAPWVYAVAAPRSGFVTRVGARAVALAALGLGAGRVRAEDRVNPAVGVSDLVKVGQQIRTGATLATVHAANEAAGRRACDELRAAIGIGDARPAPELLVEEIIS